MHSSTTIQQSEPSSIKSPLITLNVGGEHFTTTSETLTQGHAASSMLSVLASTTLPTTRDENGRVFIDRDGGRFGVILNFLRCGTLHVVQGGVPCYSGRFIALEEIEEEARFYGIQSLVDVVKAEIRRMELEGFLEAVYRKQRKHGCECRQQLTWDDIGTREDVFTLDAEF